VSSGGLVCANDRAGGGVGWAAEGRTAGPSDSELPTSGVTSLAGLLEASPESAADGANGYEDGDT
jgi:hypothetical protein